MDELLSESILKRLRLEADSSSRPKQRTGTLDRLTQACQDIASGKALAIIRQGRPEAEPNFRRVPIHLIPKRIEEYVEARFVIDVRAKRPSAWVGPKDITIRKDEGLYEYVKAVAQEHLARHPGGRDANNIDRSLDEVPDIAVRSELRLALARGRQATQDLLRLKDGMRRLRPTIDVDAIILGIKPRDGDDRAGTVLGAAERPQDLLSHLSSDGVNAVLKLQDARTLSKCGLRHDPVFGNVFEAKTKYELLSKDELAALRALVGLK